MATTEKCFACDKSLRRTVNHVVACLDDQTVWVGPDCFKRIARADLDGYQPPKGGPRLYTLGAKLAVKAKLAAEQSA